jgi:chromosome segregation ATPase
LGVCDELGRVELDCDELGLLSWCREQVEKRLESEVRHVDERVGELFDKVEGLVGRMNDGKEEREVVEGLQVELETFKKNAQHLKTRMDEVKQRSEDAHDKVRALEQKFIKEMEDKDDEIEAIQKAVAAGGGGVSASSPGVSPGNDMTAKLCSRLVDQVKRLEEVADNSTSEQQTLSERSRDATAAIRRIQLSLEQLEVHRGAVYASDVALQKVQDELRKQGRIVESLQQSSTDLDASRSAPPAAAAAADLDSMTRLREQLNLLRSEMDAGFIKYSNSLDATARSSARAEAHSKSLEALVKQTREEMSAEMEQERQRVVDSESKVRKVGERLKKQLDEALEETRASIEALEAHMSDNTSKGNRKMDSVLQPLLERTEALEEEVQRVTEAMALGVGSNNKAEAEVRDPSKHPLPLHVYIRIDV